MRDCLIPVKSETFLLKAMIPATLCHVAQIMGIWIGSVTSGRRAHLELQVMPTSGMFNFRARVGLSSAGVLVTEDI